MRSPYDPRGSDQAEARSGLLDGGLTAGMPIRPMVAGPGFSGGGGTPAWLGWLQVGLSSMLAVLFVVSLVRTREQNLEIQRLRQRVRLLEASRSQDQTAAQDEQIRAVLGRVQTVEEIVARRLQAAEAERQRLEQQMLDLHTRPQAGRLSPLPAPPGEAPPPPRLKREGIPPGMTATPLRPPPNLP